MHFSILALLGLSASLCFGQDLEVLKYRRYERARLHQRQAAPTGASPTPTPKTPYKPTGIGVPSSKPVVTPSTASRPPVNGTAPSNGTCGSPTLNVLSASLDWWYTETLYYPVSIISILYNTDDISTGWTLLPQTTPFDLSAALATPDCSSTISFDTSLNSSVYDVNCIAPATPVAASTTVITQTAFETPTASTGSGEIPNLLTTPPPASITIPNYSTAFTTGTPFVYFSTYEIVCEESTQTYPMATPFAFAYDGSNPNGSALVGAGVTGDVNPAFLGVVNQTNAIAGSWVAAPTVALIVQEVLQAQAVLAASVEQSVLSSVEGPTPTLPAGFTPVGPTGYGHTVVPISPSGVTEITQTFLQLPTQLPPPNTGGNNRPNTSPAAVQSPTAGGDNPNGNPNGSPGAGPIASVLSAIGSQVSPGVQSSPTNALQVLTQAEQTEHTNPTASAILQGLGGPSPAPPAQRNEPVIVVGGTTFTANSQTQFVIGPTATLTPGGTAIVAGTTLSLAPGASIVVVNGVTQAVGTVAVAPAVTPAPVLTIQSMAFQPISGSSYLISGSTLTPGGTVVIDGSTISLASDASSVVVDGITQNIAPASTDNPAAVTPAPVLKIGDQSFRPINSGPTYVVDGETLTPGGEETVALQGTTYVVSLASGGTVVVIETEGPNGEVTEITTETLTAGATGPGRSTITDVVGSGATATATVGAAGPSGPSQTNAPVVANMASSAQSWTSMYLSFALGSFALAVWL